MTPKILKNLNELNRGIHKQWIWKSRVEFNKSCDYLQKINYCIQDLNRETEALSKPSMKEIVFIIVLVDWIREAVNALPKMLIPELENLFQYEKQCEFKIAKEYLRALRAFVVAHPLSTNQHSKYGFDGDKICVDIGQKDTVLKIFTKNEDWYYLGLNGLEENAKEIPADYVMYIYSEKKDEMEFFKFISANVSDLYIVTECFIDKLFAFDKFLGTLKKKDWKNKT